MKVAKKLQDLIGINPNALILCYCANCFINGWEVKTLFEMYLDCGKRLSIACKDKEVWDLYIDVIRPYFKGLKKLPETYR